MGLGLARGRPVRPDGARVGVREDNKKTLELPCKEVRGVGQSQALIPYILKTLPAWCPYAYGYGMWRSDLRVIVPSPKGGALSLEPYL